MADIIPCIFASPAKSRVFGFMCLGKIMIKKFVRFMTRTQIYVAFGHAKVKIVRFTKRNSVIRDLWARSSKILFLRDSRFTRHFRNVIQRIIEISLCIVLRGGVSFLEIVFVGQCEVFVCLEFLEIPPPSPPWLQSS